MGTVRLPLHLAAWYFVLTITCFTFWNRYVLPHYTSHIGSIEIKLVLKSVYINLRIWTCITAYNIIQVYISNQTFWLRSLPTMSILVKGFKQALLLKSSVASDREIFCPLTFESTQNLPLIISQLMPLMQCSWLPN